MDQKVKKRVLVAEDEVFVAIELAETLRDLGFDVIGPALNAKMAVALAESETFDAALLDVNLGRGQTTEPVARLLRERKVPFAFLTAYDRKTVVFVEPEDPVFAKPVSEKALRDALRSVHVI